MAVAPVDGIRTGIGGWVYAPWRDNFYPQGLVQRRELEYASHRLSAIEINGTWYGAQKPATYAKWRDTTPPGFVFSAKAPMRITQARALAKTGAQIDDFIDGIATLGDRLGPLVWQFDAGTRIDRDAFAAFLGLLPGEAEGRRLRLGGGWRARRSAAHRARIGRQRPPARRLRVLRLRSQGTQPGCGNGSSRPARAKLRLLISCSRPCPPGLVRQAPPAAGPNRRIRHDVPT